MYTIQHLSLLATALLSAVTPVVSLPAPDAETGDWPSRTHEKRSTPTLPSTNVGTQLPGTSLTLQYVTIGRGTQNYTCASDGATPVQIGAFAYLYDVTSFAQQDESDILQAPNYAVYLPLNKVDKFTDAKYGYIGYHQFPVSTTPGFYLTQVNKKFFAQKAATASARSDASQGPDKTPAVLWVDLVQSTSYTADSSVGIKQVYRVETAGGSAYPVCNSTNYNHQTGLMLIDYSALYFFYN